MQSNFKLALHPEYEMGVSGRAVSKPADQVGIINPLPGEEQVQPPVHLWMMSAGLQSLTTMSPEELGPCLTLLPKEEVRHHIPTVVDRARYFMVWNEVRGG